MRYAIRKPDSHSYLEVTTVPGVCSAIGWTRDESKRAEWESSEAAKACWETVLPEFARAIIVRIED